LPNNEFLTLRVGVDLTSLLCTSKFPINKTTRIIYYYNNNEDVYTLLDLELVQYLCEAVRLTTLKLVCNLDGLISNQRLRLSTIA
jgi:hypothetical protein